MKYDFFKHFLAFIFFAALFLQAAEPEQIAQPRNAQPGINYALPGWVDIDSQSNGQSVLPASGTVAIDFSGSEYAVSRSGKSYSALSVGYDGRVLLGKVPEGEELPLLGTGRSVYVIPTERALLPVSGSSSIALKWFFNNNYEGRYTVVQVGPFRVNGLTNTYSYQVLAYPDGELQLFWWRHDNEPFWNSSPSFSQEARILGRSGLHNGSVTEWSGYRKVFLLENPRQEILYDNSQSSIRPGWIAKSFDNDSVSFNKTASSPVPRINIRFGTKNMPGGLFAYDYSREHPVAGAFEYVNIGLLPRNEASIVAWYFTEPIQQTTSAGYPSIDPITLDSITQSCQNMIAASKPGSLLPCMYMKSWNAAIQAGKKPEWIPAPAVKLQSTMNGINRELDIISITYGLRQPRSVQFIPPKAYQLDLRMGAGGYEIVEDMPRSNPYQIFTDRPVRARIIAKPGQKIASLAINGVVIYNGTAFIWPSTDDPIYKLMNKNNGSEEITITGNLKKDYLVEAEFSKCTERELALPASPSYIKTETFLDPPSAGVRKVETYAVKDGFGRIVQTQQKLGEGRFSVQGTYLDGLGRPRYAPLPFVRSSADYDYVDMFCFQCITLSDSWHDGSDATDRPDGIGFPFAETIYHGNDWDGALQSFAGLGEASFALSDSWSKKWAIPVPSPEAFIPAGDLSDESIRNTYSVRIAQGNLNYVLHIARNLEGRYSQSIQDMAGNVLRTWAHDGSNVLSSVHEYDELDRPIKNYPAGHAALASTQELDGTGRIRSIASPDRGNTESRYDQHGRLRFVRGARHLTQGTGHFSAHEYDSQGRLVRSGEVKGGHPFESPDSPIAAGVLHLVTETVYGLVSEQQLAQLGPLLDPAIRTEIKEQNVHPSDIGAVFSYDDLGNVASLKAWSYDRLGRKRFQWIVYGYGNPPIRLEYSYNASGELALSFFSDWSGTGWVERSNRGREYDSRGQLVRVLEGGDTVVIYNHSERGRLRSKTLYDRSVPVLVRSVERDISNRPLSIDHSKGNTLLYNESINYTGNSGRFAQVARRWRIDGQETVHSASYSYDALGRLSVAEGDLGGQYGFDNIGRLGTKAEGGTALAYGYQNAYRPAWVKTNNQDSLSPWHFDASGNLSLDYHRLATYRIGARGLPIDVRGYGSSSNMPVSVSQVESGQSFSGEIYSAEMDYDESNQRLWRRVTERGTGYSREEVTIPGIAVYARESGGAWRLERLELVEGGYRPGGTGDALFAVFDAQGSIRGYAKKDGLASAYAYYPYGTVQELSADGDADRSRWQAKEWDEEYGKYYFGSRFFDPYFGLWISPDPAGQFANPYTYGGDPVNYVDPDGEFAHIIFGAIVGAVGGAVHCGITEANCTRSILAGTAIGAAAAATGGAVGGAVGGAIAKAGGSATAAAIGGGAAGGAAGGAVSGVGNYATQGGDLSLGGFGKAAGFGALSGGIGGGVGGAISSPGWSRLASGFTSGAVGSAMDGGDFWDIVAGGAIGAGTAFAFTMLEIALISDLQYYEQLQEKQFTYTDPMEPTEAMINAFEHFKTFDAQVSAPESYALYNSKGEYIKGTGARGKYVNKDDQIYAAVKPTKIAKFRMSFSSGYHSIHSHNVSHEPSSQDSDLSLHKRYVKTNHYVYWRKGNNFHKYEGYKVTPMIGY